MGPGSMVSLHIDGLTHHKRGADLIALVTKLADNSNAIGHTLVKELGCPVAHHKLCIVAYSNHAPGLAKKNKLVKLTKWLW